MDILWIVAAVLLGLWLLGLVMRVAGGVAHVLLIVALAVIVWRLVSGAAAGVPGY